MTTSNKFRIQQAAVKIYVVLCGLGFTLYSGALCLGMRNVFAEFACMTLAYVLICIAAWAFRLCWLSYAFIVYSYLVRCGMILYRLGWLSSCIDEVHVMAFLVGFILSSYFLCNIKRYIYG